jgi:hypothetical protein
MVDLLKCRVLLAILPLACWASNVAADEAGCRRLTGTAWPASAMTLPSKGARITSAEWVVAGRGLPAYCKVLGSVAAIDAAATPILFGINLPEPWNRKVAQLGGGGLNGTLTASTGPIFNGPPGSAPLARGYATVATDGGHPAATPDIGIFYLNDEALLNHAYGANRKAHDLSLRLIEMYYGGKPDRYYFAGGSEGGRQAMSMLQLYPADYDGVVAVVPGLNHVSNFLLRYAAWRRTFDGGWMNKAKLKLLDVETTRQCDARDGLADGIISNWASCHGVFRFEPIRCANGVDGGDTCLSDRQIAVTRLWRSRLSWKFPLKNGVRDTGGYGVGGESLPGSTNPWLMLDEPPEDDASMSRVSAGQFVRYAVMRDGAFRGDLDLANPQVQARLQELSRILDYNDTDLTPFMARGGKLLMMGHTYDYAVNPVAVTDYFADVTRKMGRRKVASFARFYVNPGVTHGGQGVLADGTQLPGKVDLLAELDRWVESGKPPGALQVSAYEGSQVIATRPLCEFPSYPHYIRGDARFAASFRCRKLDTGR